LRVYDVSGRLVDTIVERTLEAGPHTRIWEGTDELGRRVASGVYILMLESDGKRDVHRAVLVQ
jgi:flagellar hook assembly protein FlgD